MTKLYSDRPVLTYSEDEFGGLLARVLSPSRPLQSEEFLRGRHQQLADIKQALYQPGRHVLIHGLRGVGKSSLAQTAAFTLAREQDPILVGCDRHSTFQSIVREIFDEVEKRDPRVRQKSTEIGASLARFGITVGAKVQTAQGAVEHPASTNDAVRLIQFLCDEFTANPVIVIDEFDQITSASEQEHFANFIKSVSDKHVGAKFIFCGIGESVDAIMSAHGSADRYFHTEGLGQLPWEAREEIINEAAEAVGVVVDRDTSLRVARISDGFPHYVHFLSEKLFWRVFSDHGDGVATPLHFSDAMLSASQAMQMRLRSPYELATRKYNNDYETVLWAAADGHELSRRSTDIFGSYERIMDQIESPPLDRKKFNQRLNGLKKSSHASILTGSRAGWYEFTEKMIRGYVRLRAETSGVRLEIDHPNAPKRHV
ncbi:MAG: ATP-binding protein [Pseudotabrizicola sp.]|uniref:ATP-binding protein n=1 Tax=Pseudotabrizicola sp. TaxID=2939647 RepID=UPI00272390A6|nr:ATP-binding protein [Pseudotabrizicola sp.]MDO9641356.1 ATP-binding protein [Pseudotabrizicola sp.]